MKVDYYTIRFLDADGAVICESERFTYYCDVDELYNEIGEAWERGEVHPVEPEGCVSTDIRTVFRTAVRGVDYGPDSVKRRFGGGYVPRGAYQFGG